MFGVDRTTITAWQRSGMPHRKGEPGRRAEYAIPLALTWRLGSRTARDAKITPKPATTMETVALGLALDPPDEARDLSTVVEELRACGIESDSTDLHCRVAYWRGLLEGRRAAFETEGTA